MNLRIFLTLFSIVFLMAFNGCKDDDPVAKITPTNLTVETTISTDGSGLVNFQAHADDAVTYKFFFGENASDPATVSMDGKAEYTYKNSGKYLVRVVAFSSDDLSVSTTVTITIEVDEPPIPETGYTTPLTYPNMMLVWQDEFDGDALNLDDWTFEIGGNGWGNNELQYYQEQNTIVQNGHLTIKAKAELKEGKSYTSSRIITKGKQEFKFGRIDIRALLPKGQGIWPALWMLGSNFSTVGWPKCGEIDIMEMIGGGDGRDNKLYGTVHWDNAGAYASYGGNTTLAGGKIFADEFHVFSIIWNETTITWYLDDVQYHVIDITPAELNEFQKEFFFIFNVAVGGNWPGSPNASTVFPQRMIVDYVRVFQQQ